MRSLKIVAFRRDRLPITCKYRWLHSPLREAFHLAFASV